MQIKSQFDWKILKNNILYSSDLIYFWCVCKYVDKLKYVSHYSFPQCSLIFLFFFPECQVIT